MCRRLAIISTVFVLVVLGAACQVDVVMDVEVHGDGSGQVVVGVGLDDAAVARVGDLSSQLRTEDLTAAGWTVSGPAKEGETTWVRATKPFADPEGASAVIAEVSGPEGPFNDFVVERSEGLLGTDYSVTGTIDLTAGPEAFGDEELAAALGGDTFGGTLDAIVAEEGRALDEMVDVSVQVHLPGDDPSTTSANFSDAAPTAVDASSSESSTIARVGFWLLIVVLVLAAVLAALFFVVRPRRHI